ncbi:hypothetical protein I4F81_005171 [Pyropia yezoensis]|uniref:Uncharacterized protein n=1 Tax=Pyropia yezoensis TaxID=2788 RepID=A0ACC3BYD4_PYRYE|nr:hypothetical protein I4F81_005171 [Neopyropia yezoensis]
MDGSRCARPHLHAIDDTVQSVFDAADPRLHPSAIAGLHTVTLRRSVGDPPPSAAAAFTAAAAPAGVAALVEARGCRLSVAAVRRAAAAAGLGVDFVTATPTAVRVDHDARGGPRVVLFRSPLPHWTALFLSADMEPVAAAPWQPWPDLMATLSGRWGAAPSAPACAWPVGVSPEDGRVADLAAWADYHRTGVRVYYRGGAAAFRLLPRACAAAHEGARAGRAVCVEVGDDGGRLLHSPVAAAGRRPYTDVYVDDGRADAPAFG